MELCSTTRLFFIRFLEFSISLGQLWNLVVLELTETETNYEAGFRELDKMERTKIPVKVVSVLRRNMTNTDHKKLSSENALLNEVTKQIGDMSQNELLEMYHFAIHIKSKRILPMEA